MPWLENIADNFNNGGKLIYDARNQIKIFRKADLPLYNHSTDINIKRYHAPRYFNSVVYSYGLRETKGSREKMLQKTLHACGGQNVLCRYLSDNIATFVILMTTEQRSF